MQAPHPIMKMGGQALNLSILTRPQTFVVIFGSFFNILLGSVKIGNFD